MALAATMPIIIYISCTDCIIMNESVLYQEIKAYVLHHFMKFYGTTFHGYRG